MIEDYIDYDPDPCPECGSNQTYWIYLTLGVYKCENCSLVVDDDWYMNHQPKLVKGENYPENDEDKLTKK